MRNSLKKLNSVVQQMFPSSAAAKNAAPDPAKPESTVLKKAKQNIYWQASLALLTIILTLVIIFTMSAAWYTNIVQASGLVIQVESWGFDGDIKVNATTINASPGDEGLIHLEAKSKSDSMSAVSVSAAKTRISDNEMCKRLYMYVDVQQVRNGETVERVYLNSRDSYTYTVFGQGELTLTEQVHNGPQLKWQWVYDVLGYYVLGTWSEERKIVDEVEYLRPIEYNYDEATTTFNDNMTMELKTVDGKTTVEEFLVEFSKTDGYKGEIDPNKRLGEGYYYYPVEVDENGYGVYAYMCTYAQIEAATAYDTQLAQEAAEPAEGEQPKSYEMMLNISAQKSDENVMYTGTVEGLKTAIELNNGALVRLTDDIVIAESVALPAGTQLMLDLNGHTITSEVAGRTFDVANGSKLTLLNGEIKGTTGKGYAVFAVGAEVVCSNMTIHNFVYGLCMADYRTGNTMDTRMRLVGCQVNGTSAAVYIAGNGDRSSMKSQLIIEGGTLTGGTYALVGDGNLDSYGTDIQVLGSTLSGGATAIYHPQMDSTLTIADHSTLSGHTGMAIKGGSVAIYDSTVSGSGTREEPALVGSGFSDTGDAVYVETGYGYNISVEIHGTSKLTSENGYSLQVFKADAPHVNVTVYGGTFEEEVPARYLHSGSVQQNNGTVWTVTAIK